MKNEYQDADFAQVVLKARMRTGTLAGEHPTPSGLFGTVRKHPRLSLVGDYVLMWEVLKFLGHPITNTNFFTMAQRSDEYKSLSKKEKMEWKENLLSGISNEIN